jgi:hypothetical protein
MRRLELAVKLSVLPVVLALMSSASPAQSPLGTATLSGPVRLDGLKASGSVQVVNGSRLSTGDNATVTIALGPGNEVMLAGQADVVVSSGASGPVIQVVCGDVTVRSTAPATIVGASGGRVTAKEGRVTVTSDGKTTTVKEGKEKDFGNTFSVAAAGTTVLVSSNFACNCTCN